MLSDSEVMDRTNHRARRLFSVPPQDIYEHPPGLPTQESAIPDGPIEGWDAYAGNHYGGDPTQVIGPFTAVVRRIYGHTAIVVAISRYEYSEYFYEESDREATGRPDRPCWFQSGATLRFIKSRDPAKV